MQSLIEPIMGGVIIGIAVSIHLLFNGRVTGISGIIFGIIAPRAGDLLWRALFLAGLFTGGFVLQWMNSGTLGSVRGHSIAIVVAGFLVGFGTTLGSGCTSGHGVCGLSRFSKRSFVATLIFMSTAIGTVFLMKQRIFH